MEECPLGMNERNVWLFEDDLIVRLVSWRLVSLIPNEWTLARETVDLVTIVPKGRIPRDLSWFGEFL